MSALERAAFAIPGYTIVHLGRGTLLRRGRRPDPRLVALGLGFLPLLALPVLAPGICLGVQVAVHSLLWPILALLDRESERFRLVKRSLLLGARATPDGLERILEVDGERISPQDVRSVAIRLVPRSRSADSDGEIAYTGQVCVVTRTAAIKVVSSTDEEEALEIAHFLRRKLGLEQQSVPARLPPVSCLAAVAAVTILLVSLGLGIVTGSHLMTLGHPWPFAGLVTGAQAVGFILLHVLSRPFSRRALDEAASCLGADG